MRLSVLAVLGLCALSFSARADNFQLFDFSGTLAHGTASGTLNFNETTGNVIYGDIKVTDFNISEEFFGITFQGTNGVITGVDLGSTSPTSPNDIDLALPGKSLVGYSGGVICALSQPASGCYQTQTSFYLSGVDLSGAPQFDNFLTGSLTLDTSAPAPATVTPEPASFALLGTGMLGIAGLMRRRRV